jgi:hypothetical protein
LYGKIKHSRNNKRYIDALHMRYEEFFSKYDCTLTNKAIFYTATPVLFIGCVVVVAIISAIFPEMWKM